MADLVGEFSYAIHPDQGVAARRCFSRCHAWWMLPIGVYTVVAAALVISGEGHWIFKTGVVLGTLIWIYLYHDWQWSRAAWRAAAGQCVTVRLLEDSISIAHEERSASFAWKHLAELRCGMDVWLVRLHASEGTQVWPTNAVPEDLRYELIARARLAGAKVSGPLARECDRWREGNSGTPAAGDNDAAADSPRPWRVHNVDIAAYIAKEDAAAQGKPVRQFLWRLLRPIALPSLLFGQPFAVLCVVPLVYAITAFFVERPPAPSFWFLESIVVMFNLVAAYLFWGEFAGRLRERIVDPHALLVALALTLAPVSGLIVAVQFMEPS